MSRIVTVLLIAIFSAVSISAQGARVRADKNSKPHGVIEVGQRSTYLKEGLSTEDVRRLLGEPSSVGERTVNGKIVVSYEFSRGAGRTLIAEFVDNVLVHTQVNEVSLPSARVAG